MVDIEKLMKVIRKIDPETYARYSKNGLYSGEPYPTGAGYVMDSERDRVYMLNMYIHWTYIEVDRIDTALGYLKTEPHDKLPQWVFDLAAEHGLNFPGNEWEATKAALAAFESEVVKEIIALDEKIIGKLTEREPERKEPLVLEFKDASKLPPAMDRLCGGMAMITPAPLMGGKNEEYWLFRVRLHKNQAIVGFPKFGTIGIGFENEEDSNTNLPYNDTTFALFKHIKHNKHYRSIKDADVLRAIFMVQKACYGYVAAEHAPAPVKPAQ
jgi:hypothetical protein